MDDRLCHPRQRRVAFRNQGGGGALGLTHVAFPSIPLPHHASQRCGDGEDRPSARFELWGMTLRMAADLVAFASAGGGPMPRGTRSVAHDAFVDWPPVKFPGNRAASALVGGLARGVGAPPERPPSALPRWQRFSWRLLAVRRSQRRQQAG